MKNKAALKKILIVVTAIVLVAALGIGAWAKFGGSKEPVNVFSFQYLGMTEYWGDSQESYGMVQTDGLQAIYLSTTQTVTDIKVQLGDEVKKGDILMTFDTTLSDLALERKRLDVEKLKLQLQDAQARLYEINCMKPMVIPEPEEETDENLGEKLNDPYRISHNSDFDGSSAELPLICWMKGTTAVSDEILDALIIQAKEFQTINAEKKAQEEQAPEGEAAPAEETVPPTEVPEETEPEIPEVNVSSFYVVIKVTEKDQALAAKTTWQGIYVLRTPEAGGYSFKFFDAAMVQDHMLSPEDETEEPEIDYGSGFTAAQIAQMRAEQEKTIRDLQFDIKMAEAEYKIAQAEVNDGNVYAEIDGTVVSLISEDEALMMMQPLMKVSAGGGFFVDGSISELERNTLEIGQEVTINDWNTGMVYTGTVRSLGDYPSSDGYWSGMGNPTATYYPFTVFVDETADLQPGSYVSIMFSPGSSEQGVYLENPFLRTEGGRSYVYLRGEDGLLEKRYVTTGKSLWGSYTEIREGITAEDFIAFPYGKHVKEGAQTVEAEIRALYE